MKKARNWKQEAAWYQRLVACLVHKIGGEHITITPEEWRSSIEKGIQIAQGPDGIRLRVPEQFQEKSRIITLS